MARTTPAIRDGVLYERRNEQVYSLAVGSPAWYVWLADADAFAFAGPEGNFTARKERAGHGRGAPYWKAYRRRDGALRRCYLGQSPALTLDRLRAAALTLARPATGGPAASASAGRPRPEATLPTGRPPVFLTSFVGRQREIAALTEALSTTRLLTLTGAGGVGKTRLALETVAQVAATYLDGVCWVELAGLTHPTLVPHTVAAALGVREHPGRPVPSALTTALRTRHLLVVLNNCEQLTEACARLADAVLRAGVHVTILATSRHVLGLAGEIAWRVPPLGLPADAAASGGQSAATEAVAQADATRLFVERARLVRPGFDLSADSALIVAQVCARLDGLPLAIELAAARLAVLSVTELAARLDDRFALLTGGDRMALPRHQTLRATLDWSHALLAAPERTLFARLAVFAGGWTLTAAEAICVGEDVPAAAILDLMSGLVIQSVVTVDADGSRYRLLETLRQYAWEHVHERGEADAVQRRHAAYFLTLAEANELHLGRALDRSGLDRLGREHDNLRAALRWAIDHAEGQIALRLAGALAGFWWPRGDIAEGSRWLAAALSVAGDAATPARVRAVISAGQAAALQGEFGRSEALLAEALALARALGDRRAIAMALYELAFIASIHGDFARAVERHAEALGLFRDLGDPLWSGRVLAALAEKVWAQGDAARAQVLLDESRRLLRDTGSALDLARALTTAAHIALAGGEYARAHTAYEEALGLRRALGDIWGTAGPLAGLAWVALDRGDLRRATELQREALALRRAHGDRGGISLSLDGLASVAAAGGQPERAARLFGAAAALRVALGMAVPVLPAIAARTEREVAAVRRRLGAAAFAAAWTAGQALTPEAAIEEALTADRSPPAGLTRREREVLRLLAGGASDAAIAAALSISVRTVNGHVANLRTKTGCANRSALTAYAVRAGLA